MLEHTSKHAKYQMSINYNIFFKIIFIYYKFLFSHLIPAISIRKESTIFGSPYCKNLHT